MSAPTAEERLEHIGAIACDLLTALQPWALQTQDVRSACTRLTVAIAAVPGLPNDAGSRVSPGGGTKQ